MNRYWMANILRVCCCFLVTVAAWAQTDAPAQKAFSAQVLQDASRVQKAALAGDYDIDWRGIWLTKPVHG